MRKSQITRKTTETDIELYLNVDGNGIADIHTGLGFFDHMLTGFTVHSGMDITLKCKGDLHVDSHHTVEDTGIVLGQALKEALSDKKGIRRFAHAYVPMDEALSFCALDISGRPFLVYEAQFKNQFMGEFDTAMVGEFMRAFSVAAGITLHIKNVYGEDDHHKAECLFKALARCIKDAVAVIGTAIPSSKGTL